MAGAFLRFRLFLCRLFNDRFGRRWWRIGRGRLPPANRRHMAQATLFQNLLDAPNCEAIDIQQRTNTAQQIHIVRPVEAPSAGALYRFDLGETAFPETNVLLWTIEITC